MLTVLNGRQVQIKQMIKRVVFNRIGWVLSTINLSVLIFYYSSYMQPYLGELEPGMSFVFTGSMFAGRWMGSDSILIFILLIDLIPLMLATFWIQMVVLGFPTLGAVSASWISAVFFVGFGSLQWQIVGTFVDHLLGLRRELVTEVSLINDRRDDTYFAHDIALDHTKAKNR